MFDDTLEAGRPLERGRQAAPQIYERLRDSIIQLRLPPNSVLSRSKLMDQFGVSQTPIRDALMRLAEERLVEVYAQHATVVSAIDLGQARQAHFLRQALELEVVRSLALAESKAFIVPIRRELNHQEAMLAAGDIDGYRRADLSFHSALSDAAGTMELWSLVKSRSGHIDRLRRLDHPDPVASVTEHLGILDFIEAGKPDEARHLMRVHLSRIFINLDAIIERYPQFLRR